jgi:hypothetical protein
MYRSPTGCEGSILQMGASHMQMGRGGNHWHRKGIFTPGEKTQLPFAYGIGYHMQMGGSHLQMGAVRIW